MLHNYFYIFFLLYESLRVRIPLWWEYPGGESRGWEYPGSIGDGIEEVYGFDFVIDELEIGT